MTRANSKNIKDGQCKPITVKDGKPYYPCGLIANSYFNDSYTGMQILNPAGGSSTGQPYALSEKGIAWGGESKHYTNDPPGQPSDYLPPPNWYRKFPDGYNEANFPKLADDEHFAVWMRTSALPTFTKLWARNDDDVMTRGTYEITVNMSKSTTYRFE